METIKDPTIAERVRGALLGLALGDSLAMAAHWYYDRQALRRDYGEIRDFVAPRDPHPDSILWRSHWDAPRPELDILGSQRQFWGCRGVHYHQNLSAGETTLTAQLAVETWRSLVSCGGFDMRDQRRRYTDLLTHPDRHRDTYIEECHREYFSNFGRGLPSEKCAVVEKHIGGLPPILPTILYFADQPEIGMEHSLQRLAMTHAGDKMRGAALAILRPLRQVLSGQPLYDALLEECRSQRSPHFGFPFERWLARRDHEVIGRKLSSACYVEGAVPAVIYLALKYHADPEAGLIANTNLGGDNVHRGSVLGTLLGAEHGTSAWPLRWREDLKAEIA